MNAFSRIAGLLFLAAIARADHGGSHSEDEEDHSEDDHDHDHDHGVELEVEVIATWDTGAADIAGISVESVEYDTDKNLWYFGNWFAGDNETDAKEGEMGSLSGDYPVTTSDDFDLQENIMDVQATLPSGMVYSDGYLFVGDLAGQLHKFDTSTNTYVDSALIGSTGATSVNGVCMDSDNNMLYVTTTGYNFLVDPPVAYPAGSGLFSVNPETLEFTRLYDGSSSAFPDGFIFNPNGCYVVDGFVYMVDIQYADDAIGSLGLYEIASGNFTRNTDLLADHPVCDGIVYYEECEEEDECNGVWFVTDVGQGQLLALQTPLTDEDDVFEVVIDDLESPADLCLGPDNTLAIPSVNGDTIYFAQFSLEEEDHDEGSSAARMCIISALAITVAALF